MRATSLAYPTAQTAGASRHHLRRADPTGSLSAHARLAAACTRCHRTRLESEIFLAFPLGRLRRTQRHDIFAQRGTPVVAAQPGLVLYRGTVKQGGKVVLVASSRGWLHYYAHLDSMLAPSGSWVNAGETLGAVGTTDSARGKPAHLHYAIFSPIPRLQVFRLVAQGWKRVFYRDPGGLIKTVKKRRLGIVQSNAECTHCERPPAHLAFST